MAGVAASGWAWIAVVSMSGAAARGAASSRTAVERRNVVFIGGRGFSGWPAYKAGTMTQCDLLVRKCFTPRKGIPWGGEALVSPAEGPAVVAQG